MALASSSTAFRGITSSGRSVVPMTQFIRSASTYTPPSSSQDVRMPLRRPRPASSQFFTGRPTYYEAISSLEETLKNAQKALRADHIFPLPKTMPTLQPPRASWISAERLGQLLQMNIRTNTHREVLELLNELNSLRHVASLSGRHELVATLDQALSLYEREDKDVKGKGHEAGSGIDEFGRAYAMGRRKESSARVWMVPTKQARQILRNSNSDSSVLPLLTSTEESTEAAESASVEFSSQSTPSPPSFIADSDILINHLPLPLHFSKLADRETVLRPLRLTGLIGAFNIFALVRGGGTTGQAGAIGLAVARALAVLQKDATDVLRADGALMRDTRMVERKKTGKAKARKGFTWVKR